MLKHLKQEIEKRENTASKEQLVIKDVDRFVKNMAKGMKEYLDKKESNQIVVKIKFKVFSGVIMEKFLNDVIRLCFENDLRYTYIRDDGWFVKKAYVSIIGNAKYARYVTFLLRGLYSDASSEGLFD